MFIQLPVISVVTPTFNRKDELVHLFSSMKKQTLDPKFFEMIRSNSYKKVANFKISNFLKTIFYEA